MRSYFALGTAAAAMVLTVFACSDDTPTSGNPSVPEGGMITEDGAVVGPDGELVTEGPKPSLVDVTTGTLSGFGERPDYTIAVPKTYADTKSYPLVLVMHGDGGDGAKMRGYHTLDGESGEDAIVIYPSGKSATWDLSTPYAQNEDQNYLEALIAAVKGKYSIDADRVFGVGWSSGGFMVSQLTCRRSNIFRGIVIHAGGAPFELPENEQKDPNGYLLCPNATKVATLVTHGDADGTVEPASGESAAQYWAHSNGCNADPSARVDATPAPCKSYASCPAGKPVTFCLVPKNGHGIWNQAVAVEWAFLKGL
jgi:polyhydroxybutyrate depolymerase